MKNFFVVVQEVVRNIYLKWYLTSLIGCDIKPRSIIFVVSSYWFPLNTWFHIRKIVYFCKGLLQ